MILYHVSQDMLHNGIFEARIPDKKLKGEDNTIPRVCFSSSIEGCLSSMPTGGSGLEAHMDDSNNIYKIFRIDTDKYGVKYMAPEELIMKEFVMDAEVTGEYWILDSFQVKEDDMYYIHLREWEESLEGYTPKNLLDTLRERAITLDEFYDTGEFSDEFMAEVFVISKLVFSSSQTKKPIYDLLTSFNPQMEKILSLLPDVYVDTKSFDLNVKFNETANVKEIYKLIGTISGQRTKQNEDSIGKVYFLENHNQKGKLLGVMDSRYDTDYSSYYTWAILLDDGRIVYEDEEDFLENAA